MDEAVIRDAVERADAAASYTEALQLLLQAGVRLYYADLRSDTTYYSSDTATHVDWRMPSAGESKSPAGRFDRAAIHRAFLAMERHETNYRDFVRRIWNAGVVEFEVNLLWRQITYRGTHGLSQVEPLPAIKSEANEPVQVALAR